MTPLTTSEPLNPCWIRLKQGKCRLTDDATEAIQTILLLLVAETSDAATAAQRRSELLDEAKSANQAVYFRNVHGFLKSVYQRFEQRFATREVERMVLLRKQLREST